VAGAIPAHALAERLAIDFPEDRELATAAGYVLAVLKNLPQEGEQSTDQGWNLEVFEMDGRNIGKLLVSRADETPPPQSKRAAGSEGWRGRSVAFGGGDDGAGGGRFAHGERSGPAHSGPDRSIGLAGALPPAGLDGAGGRRAAKQGADRILRGGPHGRGRPIG